MRFNKPGLRASLYNLLGGSLAPLPVDEVLLEQKTEEMRELMLGSLGADGAARYPAMARRVRWAPTLVDLWYLRGPLMSTLCAMHGEENARRRVGSISAQFEKYVPHGLCSRPSSLSG